MLTVPHALDRHMRKKWLSCVTTHVPTGLIAVTEILTTQGTKSSSFYHKLNARKQHEYVIPLVRDLLQHEVLAILESWHTQYQDSDFQLDWSQPDHTPETPVHDVPDLRMRDMLDTWAKMQHQAWCKNLHDKGWQYGVLMSVKHKTHPWLQPWEGLPEVARDPHTQAVKNLLKVLDDFGYMIKQKPQA